MSTTEDLTVEQIDRKLEALGGSLSQERIETLEQRRAELTGETDADESDPLDTDVDVAEALSAFDAEALSDPETIEEQIETHNKKLELLSTSLPESRLAEIRDQIEALQAAKEVASQHRTNTPEALAERIEVRR